MKAAQIPKRAKKAEAEPNPARRAELARSLSEERQQLSPLLAEAVGGLVEFLEGEDIFKTSKALFRKNKRASLTRMLSRTSFSMQAIS